MRGADLRWRQVVIGMVEHDVAYAARAGMSVQVGVIALGHGLERFVLHAERSEIVWVDKNVIVLGHVAGTRAKSTPVFRQLRAVLPVRRHTDPFAQEWMPPQFTHGPSPRPA